MVFLVHDKVKSIYDEHCIQVFLLKKVQLPKRVNVMRHILERTSSIEQIIFHFEL